MQTSGEISANPHYAVRQQESLLSFTQFWRELRSLNYARIREFLSVETYKSHDSSFLSTAPRLPPLFVECTCAYARSTFHKTLIENICMIDDSMDDEDESIRARSQR